MTPMYGCSSCSSRCPECRRKCGADREAVARAPVAGEKPKFDPAIFHAFKPSRIEYVVTDLESVEELDAMEKRGLTLVRVTRIEPILAAETVAQ